MVRGTSVISRTEGTYQVDHVGGKEGDTVLLEELLILIDHAIEPGEKLLGAVVGVDWLRNVSNNNPKKAVGALTDDGDAVERGDGANVVGGSDGTTNRRLLLISTVLDALAGEVGSTTLACLQANHGLSTSYLSVQRPGIGVFSYMIGALASRAASRVATTVLEEVTLTAGMANPFSRAYVKSFRTSSPVTRGRVNFRFSDLGERGSYHR